jgi:GNAT superfamily N-acetyltransferase
MIFEDQYEPELQSLAADKDYILDRGLAAWMYVDGQLAGETFGLFVADDDEVLIDLEDRPGGDFYVYSTTILPQYRGRGYGRILKAVRVVPTEVPDRCDYRPRHFTRDAEDQQGVRSGGAR